MGHWIFILNPRPTVMGNPNSTAVGRYTWARLVQDTRRDGDSRWDWAHDPGSRRILEDAKPGDGVIVYSTSGRPQVMGFAEATSGLCFDEADYRQSYVRLKATARAEHRVGPEVIEQFQKSGPSQRSVIQISIEDWIYLLNLVGQREIDD